MVSCVGLEESCDEDLAAVVQLKEDVTRDLHRLTAFREAWSTYELLSNRLACWIADATQELNELEKNPPTTNMRKFWVRRSQRSDGEYFNGTATRCHD